MRPLLSTTTRRATRVTLAIAAIGLLSRSAFLKYWIEYHLQEEEEEEEAKKELANGETEEKLTRMKRRQRRRRRRRRKRKTNVDEETEEEESNQSSSENSSFSSFSSDDGSSSSSEYSSAEDDESSFALAREDALGGGETKAPKRLATTTPRLANTNNTKKASSRSNSEDENFETPVGTPRAVKRGATMDRIKEEWKKEGKESGSHFESSDASQTSLFEYRRAGSEGDRGESRSGPGEYLSHTTDPNFFASTKFFACLELEESRELFGMSEEIEIGANQVLFRQGDESRDGIYVVVEGQLGVYVQSTNTRSGGSGGGDGSASSLVKSSSKSSSHHHHHSVKDIRRSFDRAGSPGLPNMGRNQQASRMSRANSSTSHSRTSLDK